MSRRKSAAMPIVRIFAALILAAACGCADVGVRLVSQTPNGGIVAIPNNTDQWPCYYRSRAEQLMARTCPNGYTIDREEVVAEGPERNGKEAANDDEYYEYNGALQRIPKHRHVEYQISFHCTQPNGDLPPPTPPR